MPLENSVTISVLVRRRHLQIFTVQFWYFMYERFKNEVQTRWNWISDKANRTSQIFFSNLFWSLRNLWCWIAKIVSNLEIIMNWCTARRRKVFLFDIWERLEVAGKGKLSANWKCILAEEKSSAIAKKT